MQKQTGGIRRVAENKKEYLDLLLLADEQEDMIDRYLERGTMYILEDNGVKAECVVTDEGRRDSGDQKSGCSAGMPATGIWKTDDPLSG